MATLTDAQCKAILDEAIAAANAKAESSSEDMYCGFAWVHIYPARGKFVNYLKKLDKGHNAYGGGFDVWSSDVTTSQRVCMSQSMTLKENVCAAFANVLNKHGINAYMNSRAD